MKRNEKGDVVKFTLNGKDLGEKVLNEIAEQNPWYLPVYSQLMMLEAGRGNIEGVKKWYDAAKNLNDDYATSDYRVAVLTLSDPAGLDEGKRLLAKGHKSFSDLYESYKNLGGIQKVQHQDTIAIETFAKAANAKTEAVDLFSVYYDMATISARLYKTRNDENFKTQAIQYGCMSAQLFPMHKPSLMLVAELAGLQVAADSAAPLAAYQTAVSEYAKTVIPEKDQIQMSNSTDTAIPESLLIDEWAAKQKENIKKKPGSNKTALYIGGGIVVGAGAAVVGLSMMGGKTTKSSFGAPPAFPTPD